jgi:hypothetical protein
MYQASFQEQQRWKRYRPDAAELETAPCVQGSSGCNALGCPKHDPASSQHWVRLAEARERATGLELHIEHIKGCWQVRELRPAGEPDVIHFRTRYEYDSQLFANGLLKDSSQGGVRVKHSAAGQIIEGTLFIDPEDGDDFDVRWHHRTELRREREAEKAARRRERKEWLKCELAEALARPRPRGRLSGLAN